MTTIVFDKTGTLTKGEFKVSEVLPVNGSKEELLELAAHVEGYSNHPIANSVREAYGKELDSFFYALLNGIGNYNGSGKCAIYRNINYGSGTAVFGIGASSNLGVLVKGSNYLEAVAEITRAHGQEITRKIQAL